MKKEDARAKGLSARRSLSAEKRKRDQHSLFVQMKEMCRHYSLIGCYVSMKDEADTLAFLSWALANGKRIAVPKVRGRTLDFYEIRSLDALSAGCFGVMEPRGGTPLETKDIDLMFVPLSSFDGECRRTGYGKGFYDSVLSPSMHKVGIAFSEQKVDRIESSPNDVRLDEVLTPAC
jgi:5-formyltetrahydrofolate cyclo-ligase